MNCGWKRGVTVESHLRLRSWFFAALAFAVVCSTNATARTQDVFVIAIGTDGRDFDRDSGISASGDEIDGDVQVFVNGNPAIEYRSGGVFKQINHYLKDGVNSVHLQGTSDKDLFVKIGLMAGAEFKHVVAKREFRPDQVSKRERLEFSIDIPYRLPIFLAKNRIPAPPAGDTVHPLLERLANGLADRDYEAAATLLTSQTTVWSELAYGQDSAQSARLQEQAASYYRANQFTYRPPSPESIKVVAGESIVMVYSGVNDDGFFRSKTLGEFIVNGSETKPVPAMRMVFLDGQWQIWE